MGHAIYAVERIGADVITTLLRQAEFFAISVVVGLMDSPSFVGLMIGRLLKPLKQFQSI
jgi:hypothetical protein